MQKSEHSMPTSRRRWLLITTISLLAAAAATWPVDSQPAESAMPVAAPTPCPPSPTTEQMAPATPEASSLLPNVPAED